ncbi:hypothetical protein GW915_00365 [bacterium]|nr:hypothetical protein [bacterium]
MSDTIFRTKTETPVQAEPTVPAKAVGPTPSVTAVEVPYTSYAAAHATPFVVDYFELGDLWNDPSGGFPKEVSTLEEYFTKKIESGELENSTSAIKNKLKEIERLSNMNKDARKVLRVGTAAAYVKFLMDSEDIKFNVRRYSHV